MTIEPTRRQYPGMLVRQLQKTWADERIRRAAGTFLLLAAAATTAAAAVNDWTVAMHLRQRGTPAAATVLQVEHKQLFIYGGLPEHVNIITVEFADQRGHQVHTHYADAWETNDLRPGQAIDIIYDPVDPTQIRDVTTDYRYLSTAVLCVGAAFMLTSATAVASGLGTSPTGTPRPGPTPQQRK